MYENGYKLGFVNESLIIPIDEKGSAYLKREESLIYGNEYLGDHLGSDEIADAFKESAFEEYLSDAIANNPLSYGDDYIKSTDMKEVLQKSECVLQIVIEYIDDDPMYAKDRVVCKCKVISTLKGKFTHNTPTVILPLGNYSEGEQYIVAVNVEKNSTVLTMSSKNSIFSIDQKDEIIAILSEVMMER